MKRLVILLFSMAAVILIGCQTNPPTTPPVIHVITATASPAMSTSEPNQTVAASTATITSTPLALSSPLPAATNVLDFPDTSKYEWKKIVDGFLKPLGMAAPQHLPDVFYILEQNGLIKIVQKGIVLPDPFIDLSNQINSNGNEQGLLGMALDPNYGENRLFYLNYTNLNGNTTISRFQAGADFLSADPKSEKILLTQEQPYSNHNGGNLIFGPDGFLYIGFGDGGSGGDPKHNGQNMDTILGKIIRIAVSGQESYAVPDNNPYIGGGGRSEIWASGLRNPWRFSFDRSNGDMFIADVGQNKWEEINFVAAGSEPGINFGWNYREGKHSFEGQVPVGLNLQDPVAEYDHSEGCSVTGGYVYRSTILPEWNGVYFYGDYCTGKIWGLLPDGQGGWRNKLLFETNQNISSFGEDQNGELYLISHHGALFRLEERD